MARRTVSRLELRRMSEAAENREATPGPEADDAAVVPKAKGKPRAKAAAKKPAAKRTKEKTVPRRMLMWAVYNGNMKEEARFGYGDRNAAEEKLAQLREKSAKKLFFVQPIKVPIGDAAASISPPDELDTDDEPLPVRSAATEEE